MGLGLGLGFGFGSGLGLGLGLGLGGEGTSWSVLSSSAADIELLKSAAYSRTRRHTESGVAL